MPREFFTRKLPAAAVIVGAIGLTAGCEASSNTVQPTPTQSSSAAPSPGGERTIELKGSCLPGKKRTFSNVVFVPYSYDGGIGFKFSDGVQTVNENPNGSNGPTLTKEGDASGGSNTQSLTDGNPSYRIRQTTTGVAVDEICNASPSFSKG